MEEELRDSVRGLAWARYAPLVEHYAAIRAMSDEEYLATLPPDEGTTRAERLAHRDRWNLTEAQLREVAYAEADRALPVLMQMREASGATGPATVHEYHQAVMALSTQEIRQGAAMMRKHATGVDPRRSEIMNALAEAAELDVFEFESMSGDVTEGQLKGVTDRALTRLHSVNARMIGLNPN